MPVKKRKAPSSRARVAIEYDDEEDEMNEPVAAMAGRRGGAYVWAWTDVRGRWRVGDGGVRVFEAAACAWRINVIGS